MNTNNAFEIIGYARSPNGGGHPILRHRETGRVLGTEYRGFGPRCEETEWREEGFTSPLAYQAYRRAVRLEEEFHQHTHR